MEHYEYYRRALDSAWNYYEKRFDIVQKFFPGEVAKEVKAGTLPSPTLFAYLPEADSVTQ